MRWLRAPLHVYWNVSKAAMGASVGKFLDRKATSPGRKFRWRLALSAVLITNGVILSPVAALVVLLVLVLVPIFLGLTYLYGHLLEIWRD